MPQESAYFRRFVVLQRYSMTAPAATLLICTHNRAELLRRCLASVRAQLPGHDWVRRVIVVDNASTDHTAAVVAAFNQQDVRFERLVEPQLGLSHARNRGAAAADTPWLAYLDDDARLRPGYLNIAHQLLPSDAAAFGGMYYAWFPFGKVDWLPAGFGTKVSLGETPRTLHEPYLSGGNLWLRRTAWQAVGGFDATLGMRGGRMGYAEEDRLQRRLLDLGYVLHWQPDLAIDHAVLPHKLRLGWHLRDGYAKGRDGIRHARTPLPVALGRLVGSATVGMVRRSCAGAYRLLTRTDYHWENLLLDVLRPVYAHTGRVVGRLQRS